MKTPTRRTRVGLAVLAAAGALVLGSCATDPGTPPVETPWMSAGCIDSSAPSAPDFGFSGVADQANNAWAYDTGGNVLSEDGTCTGTPTQYSAIVRADNSAGAIAKCAAAGLTVTTPPQISAWGYDAPTDAWACVDA